MFDPLSLPLSLSFPLAPPISPNLASPIVVALYLDPHEGVAAPPAKEYRKFQDLSIAIVEFLDISWYAGAMNEIALLVDKLLKKGWTYTALGETVGVRWDTVKSWHRGQHSPRPHQAVLLALRSLEEVKPPPKRRYGPEAPQRQPKKDLAGASPGQGEESSL